MGDALVAMAALMRGVDRGLVIDYILNNWVDTKIEERLPSQIRDCEHYRLCMERADYEDKLRIMRGEKTWPNSLDCLAESMVLCLAP